MNRYCCSLSLRERAGVRGSLSITLAHMRPPAAGNEGFRPGGQDPLTPTLTRREREQ